MTTNEPYSLTPEEEVVINAQANESGEDPEEPIWTETCKKHGPQEVVDSDSYTGFAGGSCYWYRLACGCQQVDESDDIRAAY
jgi:hypothetical protein